MAGLQCLMIQEKPGDLIGNRRSPPQRRWREVWLSDRPVYSELYLEGSCLSWQSFRCPGGPVNTCIAGRVFNHLNHQGSPYYLTLRSQFRKRPGRWAGCAAAGQMGAAGLSQSPGHRAVCGAAFLCSWSPAHSPALFSGERCIHVQELFTEGDFSGGFQPCFWIFLSLERKSIHPLKLNSEWPPW